MMNKFLFGILAVAALMLSSCSEENDALNDAVSGAVTDNGGSSDKVSFTATIEQDGGASQNAASSRTTVDISGGKGVIKWAYNDAISVLNTGNTFDTFTLSAGANTTSATFEGNFTEGTEAGTMAVYPAGAHSYDGSTLTVNLPATYGNTETEYTPNTNVLMLAQMSADDKELFFKHLGGGLYFDVKVPAGATSVSFTGKGICGDFTVDMSGENPVVVQAADAAEQTVTYLFKAFEAEKTVTFYIPVPTGDYKEFKIDVATDSKAGGEYVNFAASRVLERAAIVKLKSLTDVTLYEWVDLGLPNGTLWATCNVGAETSTGYGNYYAWGDNNPKTSSYPADWANYKWCNGAYNKLTKYIMQNSVSLSNDGTYDNNTDLDNEDDIAVIEWGGKWQMPTYDEMLELYNNTTTTWTENYNGSGVAGYTVTSKINSNSVFFPAGGLYEGAAIGNWGTEAYYWSSTVRQTGTNVSHNADYLCFYEDVEQNLIHLLNGNRRFGMFVRPVRSK